MVVNDFYSLGAGAGPLEYDAPLLVDANAIPVRHPAVQLLQTVSLGKSQSTQGFNRLQLIQLAPGHRPKTRGASPPGNGSVMPAEDVLGTLVAKSRDHLVRIPRRHRAHSNRSSTVSGGMPMASISNLVWSRQLAEL